MQACSTQLAELEKLAGAGNRAKLEDLLKRMQVRGHSQHQVYASVQHPAQQQQQESI